MIKCLELFSGTKSVGKMNLILYGQVHLAQNIVNYKMDG